MKLALVLLAVSLSCALALSSVPEPSVSSHDVWYEEEDEMDENAARDRELSDAVMDVLAGGDLDDEDTDAAMQMSSEQDTTKEVINARVNEDGMIEIEDMIVSPEMFEVVFPHIHSHPGNSDLTSVHRRAAISNRKKFWPNGRIVYAYSQKLEGSTAKIRAAMDEWEKYTCVKFVYRGNTTSGKKESRYALFRTKYDNNGKMVGICSSSLGSTVRRQYVNLAKACFGHKTILHEIGHTLGLIHEHQHPDRDQYVTILWDNINPKKKGNFYAKKGSSDFGIPYDPTSIMHYRGKSFKKPGCQKPCFTIQSKEGLKITNLFGGSKHLSKKSDIPIINKMYRCDATLTQAQKSTAVIG